jgi:uncharacterized protein
MRPTTSKYIQVKKSQIHNLGVYAKKDIPKKTKIIEYVGKKLTKKESDKAFENSWQKHEKSPKKNGGVYIFELNKKYDIDGSPDYNTARLINHSCNPNCEVDIIKDHIWISSIKNINKGDEISYNYGYDIDDYKDHPCRCGSKKCVGYILDEDHWPKIKKSLAKKNKTKKKN